jgi:hypothetical protein
VIVLVWFVVHLTTLFQYLTLHSAEGNRQVDDKLEKTLMEAVVT